MVNFSQLYDKHVDSLFSFGSKFTSDRELIKDCIQDVFVKLFNKKEALDKVCNIESYLYVSLRNRINDEFRRQVRLSDEEITDYNTRRLPNRIIHTTSRRWKRRRGATRQWNNTSTTCRHASSRLYTYII